MDRKNQIPMGDRGNVFTEAECEADPRGVIAHAASTGCAVVTGADGQPRFYISIPTHDLPTFD